MGNGKKTKLAQVFNPGKELQPKPDLAVIEAAPTDTKKIAPSRKSKKHIGGYFDEAVYRQMKHIGVEKGMTTQQILAEALNGFFQRHDKPPIA